MACPSVLADPALTGAEFCLCAAGVALVHRVNGGAENIAFGTDRRTKSCWNMLRGLAEARNFLSAKVPCERDLGQKGRSPVGRPKRQRVHWPKGPWCGTRRSCCWMRATSALGFPRARPPCAARIGECCPRARTTLVESRRACLRCGGPTGIVVTGAGSDRRGSKRNDKAGRAGGSICADLAGNCSLPAKRPRPCAVFLTLPS